MSSGEIKKLTKRELEALSEKGEPMRDDHGAAAPDPTKGRRLFADVPPDHPDFVCQQEPGGRCKRCGYFPPMFGESLGPCADTPVAGWLHATLPHGPRHTFVTSNEVRAEERAVREDFEKAKTEFEEAQREEPEPLNQVSRPKQDGGGLRFSIGKNKIDLIPPEWVWSLGMVLSRGAIKYAVRNWERGMAWSEVVGPMFRHAFKFICGERYDPETGCHHMAMVAWNALVLMTYDIREIGHNDLVGEMKWLDLVTTAPGSELQKVIDLKMKEAAARK